MAEMYSLLGVPRATGNGETTLKQHRQCLALSVVLKQASDTQKGTAALELAIVLKAETYRTFLFY